MNDTKAASPLFFAVSKAVSRRPPIPRSMSATEMGSEVTFKLLLLDEEVVVTEGANARPDEAIPRRVVQPTIQNVR